MKRLWLLSGLVILGARSVAATTTEVMVSSGDITSSVSSVTINLTGVSSTTYRVNYFLQKDGTQGTIGIYTNADTTGTWAYGKYGASTGGTSFTSGTSATSGCPLSMNTNVQFQSTVLQGQFYFTVLKGNNKIATVYGLSTYTSGDGAATSGWESGSCIGPTETANISSLAITSNTGKIQNMHWELWQGVTP